MDQEQELERLRALVADIPKKLVVVPEGITCVDHELSMRYPRVEILILPPAVETITKDALLPLPALKAVVVDTKCKVRPEECDFGSRAGFPRHVSIYRLDTAAPSALSLPSQVFMHNSLFYALVHSAAGEKKVVLRAKGKSDAVKELTAPEGYSVQWFRLGEGEYTLECEGAVKELQVVGWNEREANFGASSGPGPFDLVVPYGVTRIGDEQYKDNEKLRSVLLAPTVREIGACAFMGCKMLEDVDLGCARRIEKFAFYESGLKAVRIPTSVDDVEASAFGNCPALRAVEIARGVKAVGEEVFCDCAALESAAVSAGEVGERAFGWCKGLAALTLGDGVEKIGESAFNSTGLARVAFPRTVRSIGKEAFCDCKALAAVEFSEGLETLAADAFSGTGLRAVQLPSSLRDVGGNPFGRCPGLALTVAGPHFTAADGDLVSTEGVLVACLRDVEEYAVPERVRVIGRGALAGHEHLRAVRLHARVEDVRDHAFSECPALAELAIPEGVARMTGAEVLSGSPSLTHLALPRSLWAGEGVGPETLVYSSVEAVTFVGGRDEAARLQSERTVGGKEVEVRCE